MMSGAQELQRAMAEVMSKLGLTGGNAHGKA
jgi:hypothetical protein